MRLKIAVVLPRNACFSPQGATAIDLCAADFVRFSRFASSTTIHVHTIENPFSGFDVHFVPRRGSNRRDAQGFVASVSAVSPDVVVVHQHIPTAVMLSRKVDAGRVPVLVHRHAHPRTSLGIIGGAREHLRYRRFAKTIWPSKAVLAPFAARQPMLAERAVVVPNALDSSAWYPARERSREVLFVGRAHPEKGCLQAADGVVAALADLADWRARFILSRTEDSSSLADEIQNVLSQLGDRATVERDVPFNQVRSAFERAAIALVPSVYAEPFGRTALEAMSGGAAVIHSGRGGLAEVVGSDGVMLKTVSSEEIASALKKLIDDPHTLAALAKRGRERALLFDIRRSAGALDDLYEQTTADA